MSNKTYDILKYIGRIALPALATLYGTLSGIWNLPYGEAIVATISALALFLNALLQVNYNTYEEVKRIGAERTDTDRRDDSEGIEDAED